MEGYGDGALSILDLLEVSLSAVTWRPDDMARSEWIFVNEARCRMAGYTREELLSRPPIDVTTRESIAQTGRIVALITEERKLSLESTLLHRSADAVPVMMHMQLVEREGGDFLLIEHHDLRPAKKTEERLLRARENAREMLTLIEKEKEQLAANIRDNLGIVVFPLIDQLRLNSSESQRGTLDLLDGRIRHVATELGIDSRAGRLGAKLTRRQALICELIRDGHTSKDIAQALNCAPSTVNNHRNLIRKKLGLTGSRISLESWLNR